MSNRTALVLLVVFASMFGWLIHGFVTLEAFVPAALCAAVVLICAFTAAHIHKAALDELDESWDFELACRLAEANRLNECLHRQNATLFSIAWDQHQALVAAERYFDGVIERHAD